MDSQSLAVLFSATLDAGNREAAEKKLDSMRKIINFGPLILQHAASNSADPASKTAAAIYLKNYIVHQWEEVRVRRFIFYVYRVVGGKRSFSRDIQVEICGGILCFDRSINQSIDHSTLITDLPVCIFSSVT